MYQWNETDGFKLCLSGTPDDGFVFVTDQQHSQLITAQTAGQEIAADNDGNPIAHDRVISIEDQRTNAINTVQADSQAARMAIADPATNAEIAAWPYKAAVAQNVIDNTASDAEIAALQAEADARGLGETPQVLAGLQLQRATAFHTATSKLDGAKRAALDAIGAATDQAAITQAIEEHRTDITTIKQSFAN